MRVETVGRRRPETVTGPAEAPWDPAGAAEVVAALLRAPLDAGPVRARAIALGLLRQPPPGQVVAFSSRELSRLLIAGYRLPAQVQTDGLLPIQEHVRAGRRVLVPRSVRAPGGAEAAPIVAVLEVQESAADRLALLREPTGRGAEVAAWPWPALEAAWRAAGGLAVVAARGWEDLPTAGTRFFAGGRSSGHVYHWDTAECDTDQAGQVLRY